MVARKREGRSSHCRMAGRESNSGPAGLEALRGADLVRVSPLGSGTNAARPAIPHSPVVLARGSAWSEAESGRDPRRGQKARAESHHAFARCQVRWCIINSGVRSKLRGGSWNNNSTNLRASVRNRNQPDNRNDNIGFRCARDVEREASSLPQAGAGAVTAASGVRSPLPDRAPDAAAMPRRRT